MNLYKFIPGMQQVLNELAFIRRGTVVLILKGMNMEQVTQDIQNDVAALREALLPLPQAVNEFEARITTLMNNSSTMSAEDKAALQEASAGIKGAVAVVAAALADAGDGVDEGVVVE